ncbi:Putative ribokinase [Sodalis praecaptivus]|uniref:Ribokinase n=1 Tax=Sodalis praecaptivus TaxID=1239307 RepID=W0HY08_9GAMM|nr:ribokinase [Sodalis praecaptivus]AHF77402.1 Putative ribokinase [Sodalis praecaptivus]
MRNKTARRESVYRFIRENGRSTVNFLASYLSVTRETIRSDLTSLEQEGLIIRFHGGARLSPITAKENVIAAENRNISALFRTLNRCQDGAMSVTQNHSGRGKVCILGSFNVDIVARVERFPKSGETLIASENTLGPGGKGCNQAMAAFYADAKVHFVAKVGTDQFSQFARNHFKSSGMDSYTLYQTAEYPTGSAVIYVSEQDGENMIAIAPGANQTITPEEINELLPELNSATVLLVQLENNIDAVGNIIDLAHTLNKMVIVNPAPYSPEIKPYLHKVDILTPNETEASLLANIEVTDIDSATRAAKIILSYGVKNVLITLGSQGVLLAENGHVTHLPAFPAVVVDTTGAGDSFNGALAASLANGKDLLQAAHYAAAFASLAVEREGAANMPSHQAALQRLAQRR